MKQIIIFTFFKSDHTIAIYIISPRILPKSTWTLHTNVKTSPRVCWTNVPPSTRFKHFYKQGNSLLGIKNIKRWRQGYLSGCLLYFQGSLMEPCLLVIKRKPSMFTQIGHTFCVVGIKVPPKFYLKWQSSWIYVTDGKRTNIRLSLYFMELRRTRTQT